MRGFVVILGLSLAGMCSPAFAQTDTNPAPTAPNTLATPAPVPAPDGKTRKPVTDREPSAVDVATTPLNDLNIRKEDIPPLLVRAQEMPYDLVGLNRCVALVDAVRELDAMLGDDIDLTREEDRSIRPGNLAQWFVGTFVPFRGAIREISGANAQRRKWNVAIQAGIARRSFLKGVGQHKGCDYPARSATPEIIAAHARELEAAKKRSDSKADEAEAGTAADPNAAASPTSND